MSTTPEFTALLFGGFIFSIIFTIIFCNLWDRHIRKQNAKARIKQRDEMQKLETLQKMNADWIGIPWTENDL